MWNIKKWWSSITKPVHEQPSPLSSTHPEVSVPNAAPGAVEPVSDQNRSMMDTMRYTFIARSLKESGRFEEAEEAYRMIADRVQELADDNPLKGSVIGNLALFYHELGRYAEAEPLFQQSLQILRNSPMGEHNPPYAPTLQRLGELYEATGRKTQAKECYQQVVELRRKLP